MRTKEGTSRERTIIYNVFAYIKSIFSDESQRDLLIRTVTATDSMYSCTSVKRIVKENEDTKKAPSPTNKKQGFKQFKKLDDFDLSVMRRTVHSYFRNESPTLEKLLKQLKEDIDFPYGKTNLYNLLKKLGFRYQRRGREGIVNERSDLIKWRGSYLKRIRVQLHGANYRPDSFVLTLRYCANLKAIRYESASLNRIVADKLHRVIVA